jgi:bifunctional DNase/RNase
MYERFTDRARKVMKLANEGALRLNHEYLGTEHLLLGLVGEGSGVAANVLKNLGIELRAVQFEVGRLVQSGPEMVTVGKPLQTPRAKKVIDYAMEEARDLNHNYVGTEHILLGLLRDPDTVAAQVLMNLGVKLETVRAETRALLGHSPSEPPSSTAKPAAAQTSSLESNFMRCGFDKCDQKATFHLSYVEIRKWVHDQHFCEEHARPVLDSYVPCAFDHPAVPSVLRDAKQFDIDLIVLSDLNAQQVVFLREVGGQRAIPLLIGFFEAISLDRRIKGFASPRPLTHDAMAMIIRTLGAEVQEVVIDTLEEHTYHAKVRMRRGNDLLVVDIRPSDAFALAINFDCPIFFTDGVLDQLTESGEVRGP